MKLDYILGLKTESFLERQLQNQVFKTGLCANYQCRISVHMNILSFIVHLNSQNPIDFSLLFFLCGECSGPVKRKNDKKSQNGAGAGGDKEEV
ncbi:hypothetical protein A6R68_24264 [Neotoma lepida]|uniref:Uncharacterized protein n=1 Tax=Neotoma lepida TaxID=56216 RepID=A0A1A6HU22_NEOLE|nr:hypothetical protein A6R68_24264 [Neotoma lepida]